MRLKVLLPDGTIKKFPNESRRTITDGKLDIVDKDGKDLESFAKGGWTAVGRMRVASETSDEE
ncbi:MAG: hypothetical protein H0V07_06050 [Propionibacteriales bacterium]|nr:hypothetical protein [Propionibacteriales bacterium]